MTSADDLQKAEDSSKTASDFESADATRRLPEGVSRKYWRGPTSRYESDCGAPWLGTYKECFLGSGSGRKTDSWRCCSVASYARARTREKRLNLAELQGGTHEVQVHFFEPCLIPEEETTSVAIAVGSAIASEPLRCNRIFDAAQAPLL